MSDESLRHATDADGTFAAIKRDACGTLIHDVRCLKCDYNLRGLTSDRACPECGTPVARSMHGASLRACEPGWLRKLSRGCWYLWVSALTLTASIIVLIVAGVYDSGDMAIASTPLPVACLVTAWWGCWVVTSPEWHPLRMERRYSSRRIFRWVFVTALILWFVVLYVWIFYAAGLETKRDSGNDISEMYVFAGVTSLAALTLLGPLLAFLLHLRQIASRLGEHVLSRLTLIAFMWMTLVLVGLELMLFLTVVLVAFGDVINEMLSQWGIAGGGLGNSRVWQAIPIGFVICTWSLLLLLLISVGVLPWYARRLVQAASIAEATWASRSVTPLAPETSAGDSPTVGS